MAETKYLNFEFFCPEGRDQEARHLLEEAGIQVFPNTLEAELFTFDQQGLKEVRKGKQIRGVVTFSAEEVVVNILAENGIAGFSRDTQIFLSNSSTPRSETSG